MMCLNDFKKGIIFYYISTDEVEIEIIPHKIISVNKEIDKYISTIEKNLVPYALKDSNSKTVYNYGENSDFSDFFLNKDEAEREMLIRQLMEI